MNRKNLCDACNVACKGSWFAIALVWVFTPWWLEVKIAITVAAFSVMIFAAALREEYKPKSE